MLYLKHSNFHLEFYDNLSVTHKPDVAGV